MNKIKYLFLILCVSFMVGCSNQKEETKPISTTTPLLIEVTKEGIENKLYLFGSIHAADETLYPLPDYVLNAYKKSDSIAVEFDMIEFIKDLSNQMELLSKFVYTDGTKITNYIENDTYIKGVQLLKSAKLYTAMIDHYKPIMWQSLIENVVMINAGLDDTYGIDQHFLSLAKDDHKNIIELESAEYQYNMLLGFDMDLQVYLLEESIKTYEQSIETMQHLYSLYQKGDLHLLEEFILQGDVEQNPYMEEYNHMLVTVRNQNMAESLEQTFLERKTIFCTVGLAHIIGQGGIADLLEQKGYTITVVKSS